MHAAISPILCITALRLARSTTFPTESGFSQPTPTAKCWTMDQRSLLQIRQQPPTPQTLHPEDAVRTGATPPLIIATMQHLAMYGLQQDSALTTMALTLSSVR